MTEHDVPTRAPQEPRALSVRLGLGLRSNRDGSDVLNIMDYTLSVVTAYILTGKHLTGPINGQGMNFATTHRDDTRKSRP